MNEVRVGVFVCHCGTNIGGFLDVPGLAKYALSLSNVVFAKDNQYTCSEAGLTEIKNAIDEKKLNRVVVASCTPRTHEPLFRSTCKDAGLNPYLFQFANIRDQCSWVHMQDRDRATEKAKALIRMGVARAVLLEPLEETEVEVNPCALVIGGGITGMTCALSLANRGFEVKLIENEDRLGGTLNSLYKLYPTHEEASRLVQEKTKEVEKNPKIEVLTSSEVKEVEGFVGNYDVTVRQGEKERLFKVGVIIVATGAETLKPVGMYGYDGKTFVTQLELERMLKERRLNADTVVIIQCVGSRNEKRAYCSKVCCLTALKNAMLIKEANPNAQVFVLYRDMVTQGTKYEDYYGKARETGITFIKYSPERQPVVENKSVRIYDELLGEELSLPYDLVVLSTPMVAHNDSTDLAQKLKVPVDENGFFLEAHVKLRPVDFATDGIYVCGCAHWPANVSESISQAYGAASRASIPMSVGHVKTEPLIPVVDEDECSGCGLCELTCPFKAIQVEETEKGRKAKVIAASCKGCGACGAGCPQRAITMRHFTNEQLVAQVIALAEVTP
ncbi:MAG: CoB--CoM heterodisulfide reductase iron-sulfur subunit A family protein [Candidatus Bathyarchaeota archaeon]|nr:CoB--CoM heterodisulfide reductase iron-sulfur subunit A family protein [Candidatus Bathyarchaeota archaeon]